MIDAACAYTVLAAVGAAALIGAVAWAQSRLLHNVAFSSSIRRGQLMETLDLRAEGGKASDTNQAAGAVGSAIHAPVNAQGLEGWKTNSKKGLPHLKD